MKRAEKVLLANLAEANRLFATGKNGGRAGAIASQNAVIEYLSFIFEGRTDHLQPIVEIQNALVSLNEGHVLPLLKPRKRQRAGHAT